MTLKASQRTPQVEGGGHGEGERLLARVLDAGGHHFVPQAQRPLLLPGLEASLTSG